ncbi:TadE family type IV pilus minor pilin [Micromonospora sp. DT81.3]|uniref:TadE family type IV pilus minor pilin n=1 Tax=Actinomycetes TaxID=1760 RepID=UPI003CEC6B25
MRRADDGGSVAAEFAVVLPAILLTLALGAGALAAGAQQVRLQDAAADAARLVARGEAEGRAGAVVAAAVTDAGADIERRGDLVCVTASAAVRAAGLLPLTLRATSCALAGGL